jgi:hypothetical protein
MSEPLRVEPDAGEGGARICEAAADELARCVSELDLNQCDDHAWLGDCAEGRGWQLLLHDQSAALRSLLERQAEHLSVFAARMRTADEDYRDADRRVL